MSVFRADCPHCGTRSIAFEIVEVSKADKVRESLWYALSRCAQCSHSILAAFRPPSDTNPSYLLQQYDQAEIGLPQIFPSPLKTDAPEHTPENVADFYRQGMQCLPGALDAAGSMFRKALDTGLTAKFPEIEGTLYNRIREAERQHKLTPALAEWAHEIRLEGNNAVHDEMPYTKDEAERLQTFTELVLTYLFTLPGKLDEARGVAVGAADPA